MSSMTLSDVLMSISDTLESNPDASDRPLTVRMRNSDARPLTVEGIDILDNGSLVLECVSETVNLRSAARER